MVYLRNILEAAAPVCAYFDEYVQPQSVITLLKKGGRHVWEVLDNYRPITMLNTVLKILSRVLANRLQVVIIDLIGP